MDTERDMEYSFDRNHGALPCPHLVKALAGKGVSPGEGLFFFRSTSGYLT